MSKIATAVETSDNVKTGPVSASYATLGSCPSDCPLMGEGCYASLSFVGIVSARLGKSGETNPVKIAKAEAAEVDKLSGRNPLRGHVGGDCRTDASARIVSAAYDRHTAKRGQPAWTYTHAWKRVKRESWGGVSVLASCETPAQVRRAHKRGFATAIVVSKFQSDKLYNLDGAKVLPCPAQTRENVQCVDCRLCFDDRRLKRLGLTIGFEAHGAPNHLPKLRRKLASIK